MDWGFKNRMHSILSHNNSIWLAVDHGYNSGPIFGLEKPNKMIQALTSFIDNLVITRGVLQSCVPPSFAKPIILRISGGSSTLTGNLANEMIFTSMKDAIRYNITAVLVSVYVGSEYEKQTIENLTATVTTAHEYGIPVIASTDVAVNNSTCDQTYFAIASRICAEMGADIVKTHMCEHFEKITSGCPVPVIVTDEKIISSTSDIIERCYRAKIQGAAGIEVGKSIWQANHPEALMKSIYAIMNNHFNVKEAKELYEENVMKIESS